LPTLSLKSDEEWLEFAHHTFREGDDGMLHFDWDVNLAKPIAAGKGGAEEGDLWRLWRAVRRIPTLVIRGGVSDILSEATFARMKAEKPDLDQVTVPGVGHAPTLDEPECREALDAFFRRL
jgi:pimeloyl-ACP methyl ester carboxylesterase